MTDHCRDCGISGDVYSLWLRRARYYCQIDFMERFGYDPVTAHMPADVVPARSNSAKGDKS